MHRVPKTHMIGSDLSGWETCCDNRSRPASPFLVSTRWFLDSKISQEGLDVVLAHLTRPGVSSSRSGNDLLGLCISVHAASDVMEDLLDVKFYVCTCDCCGTFYATDQDAFAPDSVVSILGLDTYPMMMPQISPHAGSFSYQVPDIMKHYKFPAQDLVGENVTVGIIQLGGGYVEGDLTRFLSSLVPSYPQYEAAVPSVTAVSVDNGFNNPSDPYLAANYEVNMDLQIVLACVPKAKIRVYFAPNTSTSFFNAIYRAVSEGCNIVSISWGAPEAVFVHRELYNNLFQAASAAGTTIVVASGDYGSNDNLAPPGSINVDFPAASPWVVACGGTTFLGPANPVESVWSSSNGMASGGGISKYFDKPSYQDGVASLKSVTKRGVPDVAGSADPTFGYIIFVNGQETVLGGTSAVSPLFSGLLAQISSKSGKKYGLVNPSLYASAATSFTDIVSGNNGFYQASAGWDACTGLGTPIGINLANDLQAYFPALPAEEEPNNANTWMITVIVLSVLLFISLSLLVVGSVRFLKV
jgi:kumamolisin